MYLQNKQLWMILFSRMISASVFLGSILITYLKNTPGWCQHNSQTEVPPPTAHPLHTNQQLHFEQCKWRKNKVIKVAEMFQSTEIPKGYLWKSRKHETSTTPLFCSESALNQEGLFLLLEKGKRGNFHRPHHLGRFLWPLVLETPAALIGFTSGWERVSTHCLHQPLVWRLKGKRMKIKSIEICNIKWFKLQYWKQKLGINVYTCTQKQMLWG